MATPEMREFSLEYEVSRLKKMLLLPITNIVFDDRYEYGKLYLDDNMDLIKMYAKLFVNELVGTIQYSSDRWGPMYYTDKTEVEWDKIYRQYQHIILEKIYRQEPLAATAEVINDESFYSLSVKDKNGIPIKIAYCDYLDDEWRVVIGGLDPDRKKVKLITVKLYPPPPSGLSIP
jgi:hypothetical protein